MKPAPGGVAESGGLLMTNREGRTRGGNGEDHPQVDGHGSRRTRNHRGRALLERRVISCE